MKRGNKVSVKSTPGVWVYSHPGCKPKASWLDPYDLAAKDYASTLPYGMLEAVNEHLTQQGEAT